MPMMVPSGFNMAKNTSWLACEPESGCTLTASAAEQLLDAVDDGEDFWVDLADGVACIFKHTKFFSWTVPARGRD